MSESIMRLFAIALGGAVGAVARYGIGVACVTAWGARFAYGTLIVNVAGCFLLGLLMHEAWLPVDRSGVHWHAGVAVGLLGGLTTFSTFGYQTIRHVEAGQPLLAIGNVALNVILGLIAAGAGLMVSRAIWPAA